MISKEAAFIFNCIGVVQLSQESNFFQDILPFLQTLLSKVGHLFYGNNFLRDQASCVVYSSETSMSNLTQILKSLLRIIFVKKLSYLWVLQATRSVNTGSLNQVCDYSLASSAKLLATRWNGEGFFSPPSCKVDETRY